MCLHSYEWWTFIHLMSNYYKGVLLKITNIPRTARVFYKYLRSTQCALLPSLHYAALWHLSMSYILYYFAHLRGSFTRGGILYSGSKTCVEMHGFSIISPLFLFLWSTPWNLTVVDKNFWFLSFQERKHVLLKNVRWDVMIAGIWRLELKRLFKLVCLLINLFTWCDFLWNVLKLVVSYLAWAISFIGTLLVWFKCTHELILMYTIYYSCSQML